MKSRSFHSFCSLLALLAASPVMAQGQGFSIAVDGKHVAGDPVKTASTSLLHPDVQMKFDGLNVAPMLNARPESVQQSYTGGETVTIKTNCNYPAFVARSEIIVYDLEAFGAPRRIATVPATLNGRTVWHMPQAGSRTYSYVFRVYDSGGRFDETHPVIVSRTGGNDDTEKDEQPIIGRNTDAAAVRQISVYGGGVTVSGTDIPHGSSVSALNETVRIGDSRSFLVQRILPPGDHRIDVTVADSSGEAIHVRRDINIPTNEWFFVGMADLTAGHRWGKGEVVAAHPSEFDGIYTKGRLAFYLKGKVKGEYLLKAMADSGEGPLAEMFTGALSKDPEDILRRIDPNEFYPVYGDESVLADDAPTKGKLYVRLERGASHVMWGDFRTSVGNSAFIDGNKAVYGASTVYNSAAVTTGGDAVASTSAYAAHPGALSERDTLRGTGGSAYFLRRQDLVIGSETVSIETRNTVSGLVTDRRVLVPGADYRINHVQGVIILSEPLLSGGGAGLGSPSGSREIVELVTEYEYVSRRPHPGDYSFGGRGQHWLNDKLRVGVTGLAERDPDGDVGMIGSDIRLQKSHDTFLEAEVMQSQGASDAQWISTDGGLTYVQHSFAARGPNEAHAFRLHSRADLSDIGSDLNGAIGGTVESKEAGFWSRSQLTEADQTAWNAFATVELNEKTEAEANFDRIANTTGKRRDEIRLEVTRQLNPSWETALAAGYQDRYIPFKGPDSNGRRVNLGLRATYQGSEDLTPYAFGRSTLLRSTGFSRDDRAGIGAEWKAGKIWTADGEASYGTSGAGALARLNYRPDANRHSYVGYRVNPDYDPDFAPLLGKDDDGVVLGTRYNYSDALSVYSEASHDLYTTRRSFSNSYGATYTPGEHWQWDAAVEIGRVEDNAAADFERKAVSLGTGYTERGLEAALRGEARFEKSGDESRNRQTYLLTGGAKKTLDPAWTAQVSLDAALSNSDMGLVADGDYVNANIGFAYRPVDNDRLNILTRYTMLYDLPGPDQVTSSSGRTSGPSQRSHVLSIDGNYDLTSKATIGGKYGYRLGEVSCNRDRGSYVPSSAHLGIARLDTAILKNFNFMIDARILHMPEAETTDYGATAGLFYELKGNTEIGAGYNFGRFSDDLTDLTFDDRGVFLTLLGKF